MASRGTLSMMNVSSIGYSLFIDGIVQRFYEFFGKFASADMG